MFAGVALICAGTTAAALARAHASVADASGPTCQALPAASPSSSAPPGPTPTITPADQPSGAAASGASSGTAAPQSTEICANVQASATSVHPGQDAGYTVQVYPEGGDVTNVTVQIAVTSGKSAPALPDPTFTICGSGDGTQTCTLGKMDPSQSTQLAAQLAVPSSAAAGDTATLVATVTAAASGVTTTGSLNDSATVDVTAAPTPSPSPSPKPSTKPSNNAGKGGSGSGHSGGSGSGSSGSSGSGSGGSTSADTSPLNNLPPLISLSGSSSGSSASVGGDSGGLFPTIAPSAPALGGANGAGKARTRPYRATTVADILPLNPGQLSTQIAGLIVLGLGIVLVFARISLRKPRSSEGEQ